MSLKIADWLEITRDERIVGRDRFLNEATKGTYFCLSRMFKGAEKTFRGGEKLVDHIQGATLGNASWYNPTQRFNVSTRDTTTPISVEWAFLQSHYPVVNEAKALNAGSPSAFVNYMLALEQGCMVDAVGALEESCWALPNVETMEAAQSEDEAREPYSLLCFATRDGLEPSSTNGGVATGTADWTTIQTVNPSDKTWFQNQTGTYSAADPNDGSDGLIPMFDLMHQEVQFEMPGPLSKYGESDSMQKQCIVTTAEGVAMYMQALRSVNDQMNRLSDPSIAGPQYMGVPVKRVSELEDSAGWTAGQPDFIWLNFNFIIPFIHPGHYMDEEVTPGGTDHPNKTVVWKFTWTNRIVRSRRRLGRGYAA